MKLRREAAQLKSKAIASLRRSLAAFNSFDENGRMSTVLLHLQHACEMLLKAALVQQLVPVFDPKKNTSIGFAKCVNLAPEHLGLSAEETGTLRAVDALRDAEQHWYIIVSEALLYDHCRAIVTLIDDLLQDKFSDKLANHLPTRVLPISTERMRELQVLLDEEYSQIKDLLEPGKRRRPEARARIRTLLAMEAHVAEDVQLSEKDVDRIEKALKAGRPRGEVFPRLANLGTDVGGTGIPVTERFSKTTGAPVRFIASDDPSKAAAIREVDLQKKYHLSYRDLCTKVGLTGPKTTALMKHLEMLDDDRYRHDFTFGSSRHRCYTDLTVAKLIEEKSRVNMEEVWSRYRPSGRRRRPDAS